MLAPWGQLGWTTHPPPPPPSSSLISKPSFTGTMVASRGLAVCTRGSSGLACVCFASSHDRRCGRMDGTGFSACAHGRWCKGVALREPCHPQVGWDYPPSHLPKARLRVRSPWLCGLRPRHTSAPSCHPHQPHPHWHYAYVQVRSRCRRALLRRQTSARYVLPCPLPPRWRDAMLIGSVHRRAAGDQIGDSSRTSLPASGQGAQERGVEVGHVSKRFKTNERRSRLAESDNGISDKFRHVLEPGYVFSCMDIYID